MAPTPVLIDETLTRKVAELARLRLSDDEIRLFTPQLREIIGYVDQLQSLATDAIAPLVSALELDAGEREAPPLREDIVREFPRAPNGSPRVLASAPETLNDGYRVPPVL